jgi:hypothetical protein
MDPIERFESIWTRVVEPFEMHRPLWVASFETFVQAQHSPELREHLGYVLGAARNAVEISQAKRRTGVTDDEWCSANAPLLEKVFDANRYPTAARVGAAAGAT